MSEVLKLLRAYDLVQVAKIFNKIRVQVKTAGALERFLLLTEVCTVVGIIQ